MASGGGGRRSGAARRLADAERVVPKWNAGVWACTSRQVQAVRMLAATGSVAATAAVMGVTETRVYAILTQVARHLDVSPTSLRVAASEGLLDAADSPGEPRNEHGGRPSMTRPGR